MMIEIDFSSDEAIYIQLTNQIKAYSLLRQEGFVTIDRRRGAVISIDVNKRKALEELKQNLMVALAKGCCKSVTREEVHQLIDEIFDDYNKDR